MGFLGTPPTEGYAPWRINFKLDDIDIPENMKSLDAQMIGCNETFREGGRLNHACSCLDCTRACPPMPPVPKGIQPVFVMGIQLYYFIVGLCLVMWLVVFLVFSACQTLYLAKRAQRKLDIVNEEKTMPHSPSNYTMDDAVLCDDIQVPSHEENYKQFSLKSEYFLQSVFRRWGTWCAERPVWVIVACLILVVILSFGLLKLNVVTDPVELWTSPTSEARVQKKYFDENFSPFYRTTQIIITARNTSRKAVYWNEFGENKYFSGVLYKDILTEVLALQNNVMSLTGKHKGKDVKLNDICLQPLSPENTECVAFSPLQYWQLDGDKLNTCYDFFGECSDESS